ncbi:MAG: hypothetical protein HOC71_03940 [Candidatus Latescibacteria bacterium]|nr:hypothetical protein [Candidatus Latescibacterota bacterium]
METIIVPVDGATNIKLEVFDFDSLTTVFSRVTETPVTEVDGLKYNCIGKECSWFDSVIRELPDMYKTVNAVAPVARGASGGLVGSDNSFVEVPGEELILAYTQDYPEMVENAFKILAGSEQDFFLETGSVRDFPGSLTLIKRFLFEEMVRPEVLGRARCFGTFGILLSGHFLGNDYIGAVIVAGNEHSYWMCHTGARNITEPPGTPGSLSRKIMSFSELVPHESYPVFKPIGKMPHEQALSLGLNRDPLVIPGGHDTCLSHIPVLSTFYHAFKDRAGMPVIHVDAGSWTLVAQIGGKVELPQDGYRRDIIVQGTVDGYPVVTARYGGDNDFRHIKGLMDDRGYRFGGECNERLLEETANAADCFVLPNINPLNHLTGPFPQIKGKIINEHVFFSDPQKAFIITNLTTAITTVCQIDAIAKNTDFPIVLTAGGSRDPYFGRLIVTLTGRNVYSLIDSDGHDVSETTSLGAAITGKAAYLSVHPYDVDVSGLDVKYRKLKPFSVEIKRKLNRYRERFMEEIKKESEA